MDALQLVDKEMMTLKNIQELENVVKKAIQEDVSDGTNEDIKHLIYEKLYEVYDKSHTIIKTQGLLRAGLGGDIHEKLLVMCRIYINIREIMFKVFIL